MIPVLRSLDSLLNRFDELSHQHASFVSNFDTNFGDIENPLRDVSRNEDERRKTTENLAKPMTENDDQLGSIGTTEEFNRRITKSRSQNRPPSYCSNDSNLFVNRIPSRTSWATTESAPPPRTLTTATMQRTIKTSVSETVQSNSMKNLFEPKSRMTTKIRPKVVPQNPPIIRRNARAAVTTFTMETVIRLSRPKTYHHTPDQKVSQKRIHRRPRSFQNMKNEASESTVSLPPPPPPPRIQTAPPEIKRTNSAIIKSYPKKLKADNRFMTDSSKKIPMSNYPRPVIFLVPPPTICLTFPMQPELTSNHVIVIPKANPVTPVSARKTISIFTNKRAIIPPNRLMYLMT